MVDLSKIGERNRLKPKAGDEPHWQRLRVGCFVGFRPARKGGRGTWFGRAYEAEREKYLRKPLGDYGALDGHDIYKAARKDAEAWADEVECGGVREQKLVTVGDACRAYLKEKPGPIAEGLFRRHIFSDPIAKTKLDKLRRRHLKEWRKRLESTPALVSRGKGKKRTRPRAGSTVNRDMVPLRAALGRVLRPGIPNTESAWQEALKPIKGVGRRRTLYLDRGQRRKLLRSVDSDVRPFVQAMCLLPLRPGALSNLKVADFEARTRSLTIGKDKNGKPRQIAVPQVIAEFLAEQIKGRSPVAPIFMRGDGKPWSKDKWKDPIKKGVVEAQLPVEATAYTLRHCVLTDLVLAGVPLLTVAQLADTSVKMIEEHYAHLVRGAAEEALATLIL